MGIDIGGNLSEGIFISRENRFRAKIQVDGKIYDAHVPNTGRMAELLRHGTRIIARKSDITGRATGWDLLMVYKGDNLVCIDSRLPNDLIYNEIRNRSIKEFSDHLELKREVGYKNSRFDIYLSNGFTRYLVEIKCVTLFNDAIARFPDAPTERGRKHLTELIDAKKNGINGAVIFVIFSDDVLFFTPNDSMDPVFGRLLRQAYLQGVCIHAYSCSIAYNSLDLKQRLNILL